MPPRGLNSVELRALTSIVERETAQINDANVRGESVPWETETPAKHHLLDELRRRGILPEEE